MGLNIKKVIKDYGLEVREVAKRMDITPTGLSQHINGNPSVEVLERIAKAIGCDISELFTQPKENTVNCPYCGNRIKLIQDGGNFTDKPKPRPIVNTGVPPTPPTKAPEQSAAKEEDTPADNEPAP